MEFTRFGSTIPGSYWGCCACDVIQNFKVDPDQKAAIELVSGDGGGPLGPYAGPTYRDIFWQRIRFGTFDTRDMPNHAFIAILTDSQINGGVGKKWLEILKEAGFEFIRSVSNSVYQGQSLLGGGEPSNGSLNHIFMLVRNIGAGAAVNPFIPPKAWQNLESVVPEAWNYLPVDGSLANDQRDAQVAVWEKTKGYAKPLLKGYDDAVKAVGSEDKVFLAGLRIEYGKQQTKPQRIKARIAAGLDAPKQQAALRPVPPSPPQTVA